MSISAVQSSSEATASAGLNLSKICHVLGYASIVASIAIWYFAQGDGSAEGIAHAERFGVFVGLWAPTFFILSMKYDEKN